jgi:hypothetical protein
LEEEMNLNYIGIFRPGLIIEAEITRLTARVNITFDWKEGRSIAYMNQRIANVETWKGLYESYEARDGRMLLFTNYDHDEYRPYQGRKCYVFKLRKNSHPEDTWRNTCGASGATDSDGWERPPIVGCPATQAAGPRMDPAPSTMRLQPGATIDTILASDDPPSWRCS